MNSPRKLWIQAVDPGVAVAAKEMIFWAEWLNATTIALNPDFRFQMPCGLEEISWFLAVEIENKPYRIALFRQRNGLSFGSKNSNPHLQHWWALQISQLPVALPTLLRGKIQLIGFDENLNQVVETPILLGGILDFVYPTANLRDYGITWQNAVPTLRLWAPTALNVALKLWLPEAESEPKILPLTREADGSWFIEGQPEWESAQYRYLVTTYQPWAREYLTAEVTDPYAKSLTLDSKHSVLVDFSNPKHCPQIWEESPSPKLENPVEQVAYELHVRDFSIADDSVRVDYRGKYLAFTEDSDGTRHLKKLAAAGMTSIQLLPIGDFSSVIEDPAKQSSPDFQTLAKWGSDSASQQEMIAKFREFAPQNWGYDPWHPQAPEGSYALDPLQRVYECRAMIGALHAAGLRVILDQVYNHTAGARLDKTSVFDQIVPGYYFRIADGKLATSGCGPNFATERLMAQQYLVDSVRHWAKNYRVDGFRFDLMGLHSKANMLAVREALDQLTLAKDGVDGKAITIYGEGWNFGEVANDSRFIQARIGNLAGSGIGCFSDRLRDAVRGGSPFDVDPRAQGFGSGLMVADNGSGTNGSGIDQMKRMTYFQDLIQLGLAGNLYDFKFGSQHFGKVMSGEDFQYQGQLAAFAKEPVETISYVDCHDNETLFDALTLKLHPQTSMAERIRLNTLCLALATLGQSPTLWHAGVDILRSKSCDRNSYQSGDWFNRLDFTMTDNGFGAGLPVATDNFGSWEYLRSFLANPKLKPKSEQIFQAHQAALELLQIKRSSKLFSLGSAELIKTKLSFPVSNTWANVPGVIVMLLDDSLGPQVCAKYRSILTIFNATPRDLHQRLDGLKGRKYQLHEIQQRSQDPLLLQAQYFTPERIANVPTRCVAVFVEPW